MRLLNVRPPHTVVAYAFVVMALILVALVREGSQGRWLGGAFLLLLVTFGLLQGVWAAWAFLVFVAVGDIVVGVLRWPDWRAASGALDQTVRRARPAPHVRANRVRRA